MTLLFSVAFVTCQTDWQHLHQLKEGTLFTIKAARSLWHHGFKLSQSHNIDLSSSIEIALVSLCLMHCRCSQRDTYTTSWMLWTRSRATGCATSTQPVPWRSRTWLHARAVWTSTSTPSNHLSQARSFWCGTALNLLSAATTLHWANWLLTVMVSIVLRKCSSNMCKCSQKPMRCPHFETFLAGIVIMEYQNQNVGRLTHSLCGCLRSYSVTPTALLLKQDTKEESTVLKAERACLQV